MRVGREAKKTNGTLHIAKKIVTREGWRGLYKGLSVNLIRTVPNSAVTMLTYVFKLTIYHAPVTDMDSHSVMNC